MGIYFVPPGEPKTDLERTEEGHYRERLAAEPSGWYQDPNDPEMHRTNTIDIGVVVAGEVYAVASDGTEELLKEGDVYIQNGSLHSWRRVSPKSPGHIVFVILGLQRDEEDEHSSS